MLFVRHESFQEFLRAYPVTSAIVFMNAIMMLMTVLLGWFSGGEWIYRWGGLNKQWVMEGEVYRLVTYAFLHGGFMHFVSNMVFMVIAGPSIEKLLGRLRFTGLFFFSILMAALAIIIIPSAPYSVDIGASGFGYSLFGFYFYLILFKRNFIEKDSSKMIMAFIAIGWLTTLLVPNISIAAHLGGFAAGWIYAFFMNKSLNRLRLVNPKSFYR
ncbi:rhomboid family intramembrane serine protease [Peribacillus glennii]|nr:rhomboid family intramembrane serine protease [Peribacillus glennii]